MSSACHRTLIPIWFHLQEGITGLRDCVTFFRHKYIIIPFKCFKRNLQERNIFKLKYTFSELYKLQVTVSMIDWITIPRDFHSTKQGSINM